MTWFNVFGIGCMFIAFGLGGGCSGAGSETGHAIFLVIGCFILWLSSKIEDK